MCGICGLSGEGLTEESIRVRLDRMKSSITHRGPDGSGIHISGGTGLAHTRLSIIDLAGGTQPMSNEDGTVWVSFNGEIYNHGELRAELIKAGHHFRTTSDTEVLVHLYEEVGPELVLRLNGMFAFAIHDVRRKRVLLARDHFGIKPLFYSINEGVLSFGSEIKAILLGNESRGRTSSKAVQEYLLFRTWCGDRSFFDGVHRLPPASLGMWENGQLAVREYWRPGLPSQPGVNTHTLDEAATELEDRLSESVRSQLMSEVPLGTFCSGGVDSGLISLYASRSHTGPLHTFSVGFRDSRWDESELARDTARRIGSEHHVLQADPTAFYDALPRLIWHHDEPLSHPNSVLIALLSRYARERVTVVLTGEGADELFGGYPRHHLARANAMAGSLPRWANRAAAQALRALGGRRAKLLADQLPLPFAEAIVLNSSFLEPALVERLTGTRCDDVIDTRVAEAESLSVAGDAAASISRYDLRAYLPALLDRMDRMTMAFGLEGRVPFLDVGLADWAAALPSRYRLGWRENKRVVKRLASRHLSPKVTHGPKSGFGVPTGDWIRSPEWGGLVERMRDLGHPAGTVVESREVVSVLDAHLSGRADHSEPLWLLSNLYLWHESQAR